MLRLAARTLRSRASFRANTLRAFSDVVKFQSPGGIVRVPLNSPKVIGVATSRGTRDCQEDAYHAATLSLPSDELAISVAKHHDFNWHPSELPSDLASQVLFVGIYDGHGGSFASSFLRDNMHKIIEDATPSQVQSVYDWMRGQGGYFRRWKGGDLAEWVNTDDNPNATVPPFDLNARATLAFLSADKEFAETNPDNSATCGATASVALLQSLDVPAAPFFSAHRISVTVAHVGDTRVLLCATDGGRVEPLTETHHSETRGESARLRRMGTSRVMDSFGETRWMGALANTRCIGDSQYKRYGVTPEPTFTTRLLEGPHYAYMILVSDGISGVLSDDEIVDLARDTEDPSAAARAVLSFAEELGTQDNSTVVVVPLAGWGKIHGPDTTKDLREYRKRQAMNSEREHRM